MRCVLRIGGLLAIGVGLGCLGSCAAKRTSPGPAVQSSLSVNDDWTTQFLRNRLKAIEWTDGEKTVSLQPANAPASPNQNITLVGRTPLTLPDDHSSMTIQVVNVTNNVATIASVSQFHHASFGKNLITIDCRVVELEVASSPIDEAK